MDILDLAFALNNNLNNSLKTKLIDEFGSVDNLLKQSPEQIVAKTQIQPAKAQTIFDKELIKLAEKELKTIQKEGARISCATDADYSALLKGCLDRPHILFYKGNIENIHNKTIAVVGTREYTPYGSGVCRKIISQIAERAPETIIVSGLASGIDTVAHTEALECGLRTVAVIASQIDTIVPATNRDLARRIIEAGGAIITEHHSQTKFHKALQLERNRIVAGLSEGTLVVESGIDGGSMTTAEYAFNYDREVMAIPGHITEPKAAGCHKLINRQKARLVACGYDIISNLGWTMLPHKPKPVVPLTDLQHRIMAVIGSEKVAEAKIARELGKQVWDLHMDLFFLETHNLIMSWNGGFYTKI